MRRNYGKWLTTSLFVAAAYSLPQAIAQEEEWDVAGFVENSTFVRDDVGLSKFRNTAQLEFGREFNTKGLFSQFSFQGVLRATYDGVYDLNSSEFGEDSGGAVSFINIGAPAGSLGPGSPAIPAHTTPYGSSIVTAGTPGLPPSNAFGFDTSVNPNAGLAILGSAYHEQGSGVVLAYPTRPCDVDSRGCINGYLDYSSDDLRFSEFNDKLDFIRELYVDGTIPLGDNGSELGIRLGKQQVVWGRTDLFRVLDVLNPVDYSRHNIYDELEDIRIPQWMLSTEARLGPQGPFTDLNFSFVWNFDEFRPNNLGQGGTPYSILDAGPYFRAMNVCWELGCTVGNFAGGGISTDFGPGQIGIRKANLPEWSFQNTQIGLKMEGVINDVGFSLNYIDYISQLPSLRGGIPAMNSFTGETNVLPYLIAFDIEFPRVHLYGGSLDFYADSIKSAIRVEAAYSVGEEFANTTKERLFSSNDVIRYVIGVDHNAFLPFVDSNSAALISAQVFGQHILDHDLIETAGSAAGIPSFGRAGIPDWKENWTATLLVRQPLKNGLVNPQVIAAHDFRANATVVSPSIEWLLSNSWKVTLGANFKFGKGAQTFDDCRSCNPFPPFTATALHADPFAPGSVGLSGFEPLGRFRQGPIGSATAEDELQLTIRYRF
ncbi:MAG: cox2 cytochrome oxidase subunit 2 [Hyphomonas sp. BRH_c22]|nr:MAG: cox2 cytochrome oxidase subunit 2 [Hyphomonas sp. BRH_c22]